MNEKDLSLEALFQEYVRLVKKKAGFRDTLIDIEHKRAFDRLLKEAWSHDRDAILKSRVHVLEALSLTANVHTKRNLEELRKRVRMIEQKLKKAQP